jgi:hypothetical protein
MRNANFSGPEAAFVEVLTDLSDRTNLLSSSEELKRFVRFNFRNNSMVTISFMLEVN